MGCLRRRAGGELGGRPRRRLVSRYDVLAAVGPARRISCSGVVSPFRSDPCCVVRGLSANVPGTRSPAACGYRQPCGLPAPPSCDGAAPGRPPEPGRLARDAGLPPTTALRYIHLLETSYQVVRLESYAVNRTKRLVKSPRLYWSDTGLALHVARSPEPGGAHLENLLVNDLLAWRETRVPRPEILFWRTSKGRSGFGDRSVRPAPAGGGKRAGE